MDLALEDIIKQSKPNRGMRRNGAPSNQGNRRGASRVGSNRLTKSMPFPARTRNVPDGKWIHDRFGDNFKNGGSVSHSNRAINSSAKLTITNLDFGVSDSDIKELFGEFGALRRAAVHYEKSGRSLGTADIVFERRADALRALKQYDGVPLDGRAMKIQLVDNNGAISNGASERSTAFGNSRMRGLNDRVGNMRNRRSGSGGPGNNNGRGRGSTGSRGGRISKAPVTQEQLDADLDAYVNKME